MLAILALERESHPSPGEGESGVSVGFMVQLSKPNQQVQPSERDCFLQGGQLQKNDI